jgi:hypothetical protein
MWIYDGTRQLTSILQPQTQLEGSQEKPAEASQNPVYLGERQKPEGDLGKLSRQVPSADP